MFEAPQYWDTYYDNVVTKCESYINFGYWDDIDLYQLRAWLSNFHSNEEKYFSACILDALVYRSRPMVRSSLRTIASSIIPQFLKSQGIYHGASLDEWLDCLRTGRNVPIRFVSMENVDNKAGKSGSIIIRELIEVLDLAAHLTLKPERISQIPEDVKVIVLVDDFAGTGEQFCQFFEKELKASSSNKKILYVPLAAHRFGLENIKSTHSEVTVSPVELLTEDDSFFSPINGSFRGDDTNTIDDAKAFYFGLCKRLSAKKIKYLLGKGDLGLTFSFHLSTPNNNLKIIYHNSDSNGWSRLLYRRK